MPKLTESLELTRGPAWRNRFMLAPLTNIQSAADGVLSDDEFRWLTMRAEGGFGAVSTCASHVREQGIGFPGQLGCWDDRHVEGLKRLADKLNREGAHSIIQLHHAGMRTPGDLISGAPECPSDNEKFGAKAMPLDDVERLRDDFVAAARRAVSAGFYGVELHGAHGYLLSQFLSADINHRDDSYGGSLENRARLLFDVVDAVRAACPADFSIGVRLSPERFGMRLPEVVEVARRLCDEGKVDYLDLSLWDVFKKPAEDMPDDKLLLEYFTELDRGPVKMGAAGKIYSAADAQRVLDSGLDFAIIGRGAILHHDFPRQAKADPGFRIAELPVSAAYLDSEGVGPAFVKYLSAWEGFVAA